MTQTWAKPCPDSDVVLDVVHEWMTKKSGRRRDRVVRGDYLDLVHTMARDKALSIRSVSDAMSSLIDTGCIEKVEAGFLVTKKFVELAASPAPPDLTETHYARSAWGGEESRGASAASGAPLSNGGRRPTPVFKQESAQNEIPQFDPEPTYPKSKVVVLARTTFPSLCLEAGIAVHPMQFSWTRLAAGINRWQRQYGIDLGFVRQMMSEFVKLRTIRNTNYSPDVCFLARREQLTGLVLAQQKHDPGNRRHSGGAEYWLGEYAR